MAVFHFRLAQVLRLQQAMEEMEKRELQLRLAELTRTELELAQARAQRSRFVEQLQQAESSSLSAAELASGRRWHPVLLDLENQWEQSTVLAMQAADAQREQVQAVRLERRTLEQLQERQAEQFNLEQSQLEQVALDELAVQDWPSGKRL